MKWKILIVLLILALMTAGCTEKTQNSNSSKALVNSSAGQDPQEVKNSESGISGSGVAIDSVVFLRAGALITLKDEAEVSKVKVSSGNTKLLSLDIGKTEAQVFTAFDWDPKTQYRFEVVTNSGTSGVSEAYSPEKPALKEEYAIELGDVNPGSIEKVTENLKGVVKFSPDSKYLAIGTDGGSLILTELATGKKVWEKQLVEGVSNGKIMDIEFSGDGSRLFVSEQSPDAFVYCFDLNGKEIWKFGAGTELGTDLKHMPSIKKLKLDAKGNVYASANRACGWINGKYKYLGRVYSFDPEGKLRWKFPESELMDSGVTWVDTTPDGKYTAFGTASFSKAEKWKDGTVYVVDGNSGKEAWHYTIDPLEPYFDYVSIWYSTIITPDGGHVITLTGDGRGFVFNNSKATETGTPDPMWEANISTPIIVSGVPIYASATYTYNINNTLIYSIGSTYSRDKNKEPPFEHPNGNSLFAYDLKGNLLWKWRIDGYPGESAWNDRYLVVPIAQNLVTDDRQVHGAYVFDVSKSGGASSKIAHIFRTKGLTIAADISQDGRYIAAMEVPARLEDGTVLGEYKVHILA